MSEQNIEQFLEYACSNGAEEEDPEYSSLLISNFIRYMLRANDPYRIDDDNVLVRMFKVFLNTIFRLLDITRVIQVFIRKTAKTAILPKIIKEI